MSNSDEQIEEIHGPSEIEIKIIDKDNENKDFQPEIDYNEFDFEQYMNNLSMKETLERTKSGQCVETKLTRKKSSVKNKDKDKANEDEVIIKGFLDRKVSKILKTWEVIIKIYLEKILCVDSKTIILFRI